MTLTPIIDVRDISVDDVLVEAFATPDIEGMADFKRLYFTFTDVTDPSVYMRVSVRHSNEGDNYPNSYFLAAGNGQQLTGYEAVWDRCTSTTSGVRRRRTALRCCSEPIIPPGPSRRTRP